MPVRRLYPEPSPLEQKACEKLPVSCQIDLNAVPPSVTLPSYDRKLLRPRLVHIGFGAFARAHVLDYLDRTLSVTGETWGARAIKLRSGAESLSDLAARQYLFTHVARDSNSDTARINGALCAVAHPASDGADGVINALASPETAIVTLTITEKGYCSQDRRLDIAHPDIKHDLDHPEGSVSAPGLLARALAKRRASGSGGITIMSCDNLSDNGALCRAVVTDFADAVDPGLSAWIKDAVTFPSTMVDRITPAMQPQDYDDVAHLLGGQQDPHAVITEPFTQWVIEDDFAAGRPDLDIAGVQFVSSAAPYETMKLRMLNGAHSALAYIGPALGHETVADCMGDTNLRDAIAKLMLKEAAPTLSIDTDTGSYAKALMSRFANRALRHRLSQIAKDGSQKLPQRLLVPLLENHAAGRPAPVTLMAVAAWMRHVATAKDLDDPLAARLQSRLKGIDPATRGVVRALVKEPAVFPAAIAETPGVIDLLAESYARFALDPAATIATLAGEI
jgi:fructuronate reductase